MASMHEGPAISIVGGRYRLGEKLGAGSAGVVWRAHDQRLGRDVAVKQLAIPPGLAGDDVARMHADAAREGRITARLDHPAVVAMLDMVVEAGCSWLVMEYVAGSSLAAMLDDGPLTPVEAARIGAAVAGALAAAHAEGVVHSDVKPTNVLLGAGDTVKLADFGVAHAIRNEGVTGPDEVSGTPLFMAPEIARGKRPSAASDVYSLAATLYAMVEGHAPFGTSEDDPLAVMHRVAQGRPAPARRAGPLAEILAALFETDPERRPSASVAQELLAAETAPVRVTTTSERPRSGVVALRTVRPAASATARASRVVPLSVVPVARRSEHAETERGLGPVPLTVVSGGGTTTTAGSRPGRPRPRPGGRRTPRALVPLSAAGVVAVSAIAGALGGGPGMPLIQTASDLLNRVVGAGGEAEPVPATLPQAAGPFAPSQNMAGAALPVPVSAPPIVPDSSDVFGDQDLPSRSTAEVATASSASSDDSDSTALVPALPVAGDLPVAGPVTDGLLSGDGGGVTGSVSQVVDGLTGDAGITTGLSGVTGDLSHVTGDLSGVTGDLTHVSGDLTGITGDLSDVTGNLSNIDGDLSDVTGDLSGVTGSLTDVTGDLTDVTGNLSGVTGNLSDVTGNLSGVTGDLSGVTGNLSNLDGDLSHVAGNLSGVTGDLAGVTGNLSSLDGDLSDVTGNLSGVTGDLSNVTGNLSRVDGDLTDVTGNLSHLSGSLSGVTGDLSHVTGNVSGLSGDLSDVTGVVGGGGNGQRSGAAGPVSGLTGAGSDVTSGTSSSSASSASSAAEPVTSAVSGLLGGGQQQSGQQQSGQQQSGQQRNASSVLSFGGDTGSSQTATSTARNVSEALGSLAGSGRSAASSGSQGSNGGSSQGSNGGSSQGSNAVGGLAPAVGGSLSR